MAFAGERRVLIIVQNLPVPFDRRVWLESTSLQRAGYTVSVICPKMLGFNKSHEVLEDIDIYRYPMPINPTGALGFVAEFVVSFLYSFALSIKVAWRGRGFDVIHACNPPETSWMIGLFWKIFGKRFVFDQHDLSTELYDVMFPDGSRLLRKGLVFMEKASFRTSSVAIAPNESHKRVAVDRGGLDPEHVYVVRSGPDLKRFKRYEPDPQWRKGKEHLIAFLGEMGRQDGVDKLVQALATLRDEYGRDDFHGIFIGNGTHREPAIELASELGIAELCTFTGIVSDDDLCRILSSVDLGVDPVPKNEWSDRSTMNKIMEYMFFGVPVVAFDLTEARHSAGDAGTFAEPNSPKSLAATINEALDDSDGRARRSALARRRIEDELSWEHSEVPLLAAYEDIFSQMGR